MESRQILLTRDVQDCVGFGSFFLQLLNGLLRRKDYKFDLSPLGFTLHLVHHWQCAGASADHESAAFPRNCLLQGERRVTECIAELFRRLLFAPANFSTVDHHVVVVGGSVDANGTKGKLLEAHWQPPACILIESLEAVRPVGCHSASRCNHLDHGASKKGDALAIPPWT